MIAYIYRPKRQRNGKLVSSRIWRARLKLDGDVKARDISLGVSDRQVAEQKMRENIRDRERVSVGLMAPAAQRETFENPMAIYMRAVISSVFCWPFDSSIVEIQIERPHFIGNDSSAKSRP